MKFFELWSKARQSRHSGDLAIALGIGFLVRSVPAWLGAWQPSTVEAVIAGVSVGLISLSFDLMPEGSD